MLALKNLQIFVTVVLLFIVGFALKNQPTTQLVEVGDKKLHVVIANTPSTRQLGLSYKPKLPRGEGMLFSYNEPARACMWMKDMNFPIDVYWFSATGKLISSKQNIKPQSYPAMFCPAHNAFYMLEVNVGEFTKAPTKLTPPKQ